jgi:hypothetical protein
MFGSKVPDVLQDMKRAKFRDEVIGPLGLYVKIAVCFCHFIFGVYVCVCVCACNLCVYVCVCFVGSFNTLHGYLLYSTAPFL